MRQIILLFATFLITFPASASWGPCTRFQKRDGINCVFNGRDAHEWIRQCTHAFDNTIVCLPFDPNNMRAPCTRWVKSDDGITQCSNGNRFERRWVRGCIERLFTEEFCDDHIDPNTLDFDKLEPIDENDPLRNPNRRPNRRPCAPGTICG